MYRIYVTDVLRLMGHIDLRYIDIVDAPSKPDLKPEEVVTKIRGKLSG